MGRVCPEYLLCKFNGVDKILSISFTKRSLQTQMRLSTLFSFVLLASVLISEDLVLAAEPAWLAGQPMNQWLQINGTVGAGGAYVEWGGLVLREDTTELFIIANGGHHDSYDNRVVSIKLTDDQPQWTVRAQPSPKDQVVEDVPYYKDGKPTSRHGYQHNHWVPAINRVVTFGGYGIYGSGSFTPTVDGFNPDTNEWDPQGTWPDMPKGYGVMRERNSSIVWGSGLLRIDLKANEFTYPITTGAMNVFLRWPLAHDTKRHQLFNLQFGDGQGYNLDLGIQASRVPLNGNKRFQITFTNNTAMDLFYAEAPTYSAMDYDPINDRFLFYYGQGSSAGRIYVITPSDTSDEWEKSIFPLAEGSAMPPPVPLSGLHSRFLYESGLNVFVMLPNGDSNIYFLRVGSYEQVPQSASVSPQASGPQSSNTPSKTPNTVSTSGSIQSMMIFSATLLTFTVALVMF